MFGETSFLLVFGLGAACMMLGFFLVVRGIGTSESESTIKVVGIEIRASKVGPGVLFALFGLVLVVIAILKLQGPSGRPIAAESPPAQVAADAPAPAPRSSAAAAAVSTPTADPTDLVGVLAQHNVHSSQGEARLQDWLAEPGSYYRRLAEATLVALGHRRLSGAGVDLLTVNGFYLRELGVDDEAKLPPNHVLDPPKLQRALVLAYRDANGGAANTLAEIAQ